MKKTTLALCSFLWIAQYSDVMSKIVNLTSVNPAAYFDKCHNMPVAAFESTCCIFLVHRAEDQH